MGKPTSVGHRAFISPTSRSFDPQRTRVCYSACCSLFIPALTWAVSYSHRAWLVERIRHRDDKLQETPGTVAQLPAFRRAGKKVAEDFVEGEKIDDNVNWKRAEEYDALAQEMIELYIERREASGTKQDTDRVKHLGHGVYVQRNKHGIDADATENNPITITREESRSVVYHALDALKEHSNVCVTGQPGIGKTRGCMMYAIQALLNQGAAVLYVGYKSENMLLFLPGEDGKYRVWKSIANTFSNTFLKLDKRVVAVIDPPEQGSYSARAGCRVLMFASNNAKKHFDNWEKDGILLVTSMPSTEEVVLMEPVLWDEEKTLHPWQLGEFNSPEERRKEVEKRIELVGPIPRLIFSRNSFTDAVDETRTSCEQVAKDLSDFDLYMAFRGEYKPFIGKHAASTSSKVLFLNMEPIKYKSWRIRKSFKPKYQLTPIAIKVLRERLIRVIDELRKEIFEDFVFNLVCERRGCLAEIQQRGERMEEKGFERLVRLRSGEGRLFRPSSKTFPFIDFALSITTWFNVKSVDPSQNAVLVKHGGAKSFLEDLENRMRQEYTQDEILDILKREPPVLTVVTNRDIPVRLDKEIDLKLCNVPVKLETMDVSQVAIEKDFTGEYTLPEIGISRTDELLHELDKEQEAWEHLHKQNW